MNFVEEIRSKDIFNNMFNVYYGYKIIENKYLEKE